MFGMYQGPTPDQKLEASPSGCHMLDAAMTVSSRLSPFEAHYYVSTDENWE